MKRITKIALWTPVIVILTAFGLISFLGLIFLSFYGDCRNW